MKIPKQRTWSDLAIRILREWNPGLKGGRGFAADMRKLLTELEGENIEDDWKTLRPRFIPDAYLINHQDEEVLIVEVEDTHPLTSEKLTRLINFYWWLDGLSWKFRVFTTDRYGQNQTEIPLFAYSCALVAPEEPDLRIRQLTDQQKIGLLDTGDVDYNTYVENCLRENEGAEQASTSNDG